MDSTKSKGKQVLDQKKTVNTIKFNRVNGWTYKTSDNQFLVYNGGPNEWYSAPVDPELVAKFGFCSVAIQESNKVFHNSLCSAQNWVRDYDYKAGN